MTMLWFHQGHLSLFLLGLILVDDAFIHTISEGDITLVIVCWLIMVLDVADVVIKRFILIVKFNL